MIKTNTKMMPHQRDAYRKLIKLKVGALYMGMGTGKTRTAIELIKDRINAGKVEHVLWFCPCSVKTNLKRDIELHSNLIDATTIIGIESVSMSDRTYLDILEILQQKKCFLVVDESNLIKNYSALRTKRITYISELCEYKLILNGTPITKNEADLYSQWCILDKRIFGYRSFWSFAENHLELDEYGKIVNTLNVDYLTEKMAPYSFEVSKDKCLTLPDKVYMQHYFDLTYEQRIHYAHVLNHISNFIFDDRDNTTVIYNLLHALQLVVSGRYVKTNDYNERFKHRPFFDNPTDNPRIILLDYVLDNIDGKVIIWCKYHFEIEDVKTLLSKRGLKYVEFHGGIPISQRDSAIDKFKNDESCKVMIGNKTSGGYGLNLQFCNNMIYYSSDFNWGAAAQSEDRIHRIGQDKSCLYHYLWADIGIDEMIMHNLERKEDLEASIRAMLNVKNFKELLV